MYDVIIIGGGPAGLSAAIYTARRTLKTLILTADIGGQIAKTHEVENYPGFDKISGVELALKFKSQAEKFGAKIKYEQAIEIKKVNNHFVVKTNSNDYKANSIILAFGKQPMELGVSGEAEFKGRGVSYCATCDAPFFKEKVVAVVGGGNSALDAALLLANYASKVFLIHRKNEFRAEELLINQVKANSKIELVLEDQIKKISGEQTVKEIKLLSGKTLPVNGIIVEIGYEVRRDFIKDFVKTDELNQIIITSNQETSIPGVFAAGDLTTTPYKQVVIAAGEGAKAALSCFKYIQSNSLKLKGE